jgi:hypothetical protein
MTDDIERMEEALRALELILEDANDWADGSLIEHLDASIECLNEAISNASGVEEEDEEGDY